MLPVPFYRCSHAIRARLGITDDRPLSVCTAWGGPPVQATAKTLARQKHMVVFVAATPDTNAKFASHVYYVEYRKDGINITHEALDVACFYHGFECGATLIHCIPYTQTPLPAVIHTRYIQLGGASAFISMRGDNQCMSLSAGIPMPPDIDCTLTCRGALCFSYGNRDIAFDFSLSGEAARMYASNAAPPHVARAKGPIDAQQALTFDTGVTECSLLLSRLDEDAALAAVGRLPLLRYASLPCRLTPRVAEWALHHPNLRVLACAGESDPAALRAVQSSRSLVAFQQQRADPDCIDLSMPIYPTRATATEFRVPGHFREFLSTIMALENSASDAIRKVMAGHIVLRQGSFTVRRDDGIILREAMRESCPALAANLAAFDY